MLAELVNKVAGKPVRFAVVTYRAKRNNELARHSLTLGDTFGSVYQQDVAILKAMIPTLTGLQLQAATELLKSREESLTVGLGNNSRYTHAPQNGDTYVTVPGLPGIKVHKETGELYVMGLSQGKVVLEAGEPEKPVKSRPLTLAKREIEKALESRKIRQMILKRVTRLDVDGETLILDAE